MQRADRAASNKTMQPLVLVGLFVLLQAEEFTGLVCGVWSAACGPFTFIFFQNPKYVPFSEMGWMRFEGEAFHSVVCPLAKYSYAPKQPTTTLFIK